MASDGFHSTARPCCGKGLATNGYASTARDGATNGGDRHPAAFIRFCVSFLAMSRQWGRITAPSPCTGAGARSTSSWATLRVLLHGTADRTFITSTFCGPANSEIHCSAVHVALLSSEILYGASTTAPKVIYPRGTVCVPSTRASCASLSSRPLHTRRLYFRTTPRISSTSLHCVEFLRSSITLK